MSDRCKERVPDGGRMVTLHQCRRKAKKDGYCTQHHPDSVANRREESDRKWNEKQANSPYAKLKEAQTTIATLQARIEELENPWTAAEEQLPPPGEEVLAWLDNMHQVTFWNAHDREWDCWLECTHWMPLPTPPEKPQ